MKSDAAVRRRSFRLLTNKIMFFINYFRTILLLSLPLLLYGCASQSVTSPPPVENKPAIESDKDALSPTRSEITEPVELSIAAVGDIMLGSDYPSDRLPADDGRQLLAGVAEILRSADLTFGNLEGTLLDGGEPAKKCSNPSLCYLFRTPSRYVNRLVEAGFDLVSLANNHVRDFGEEGRSASMQTLDSAGIAHSGRAGDIAVLEAKGVTVAMIAYAPYGGSHFMLDIPAAKEQVGLLSKKYDVVLVSFHSGAEGKKHTHVPFAREYYYGEDRGDVVEFARAMVDAGADMVIGHGPHVPRAVEVYRERLIAYSLGNFATFWGVNIRGINGLAPIILATLDGEGRFLSGRVVSAVQRRPEGTLLDPEGRALSLIRTLSKEDFPVTSPLFTDVGTMTPPVAVSPLH